MRDAGSEANVKGRVWGVKSLVLGLVLDIARDTGWQFEMHTHLKGRDEIDQIELDRGKNDEPHAES